MMSRCTSAGACARRRLYTCSASNTMPSLGLVQWCNHMARYRRHHDVEGGTMAPSLRTRRILATSPYESQLAEHTPDQISALHALV
jgi:hypothetical protein